MLYAVLAALAAAALFAVGTATQHRSVRSDAPDSQGVGGLVRRVLGDKWWWLGLLASLLAFVAHATALSLGDLALVQPVVVSGIVFSVAFRAALERRWPSKAVLGWCLLTWAGLACLVLTLRQGVPRQPATGPALWFLVAGIAVVLGLAGLSTRASTGERKGLLLGAAAGVLFGLSAGLLKLVTVPVRAGQLPIGQWSLWALIVVGVGAVVVNQAAFRVTRLSVSMPVVNIMNVTLAMAFGWAVFGERLFNSPARALVVAVALGAMIVGVRQLARPGHAAGEDAPSDSPSDASAAGAAVTGVDE